MIKELLALAGIEIGQLWVSGLLLGFPGKPSEGFQVHCTHWDKLANSPMQASGDQVIAYQATFRAKLLKELLLLVAEEYSDVLLKLSLMNHAEITVTVTVPALIISAFQSSRINTLNIHTLMNQFTGIELRSLSMATCYISDQILNTFTQPEN